MSIPSLREKNPFLGDRHGIHWIAMFISIIIYRMLCIQVANSMITMITGTLKLSNIYKLSKLSSKSKNYFTCVHTINDKKEDMFKNCGEEYS